MVGGNKIITTYISSYKKNVYVLKYNDNIFFEWYARKLVVYFIGIDTL